MWVLATTGGQGPADVALGHRGAGRRRRRPAASTPTSSAGSPRSSGRRPDARSTKSRFVDEPTAQPGEPSDAAHVRAPDRLAGRRCSSVLVGCGVAVLVRARAAQRRVLPARRAQRRPRRGRSLLIVVGLMLATTIIAAALGTGDTMGRTVRSTVVALARPDRRVGHGRRPREAAMPYRPRCEHRRGLLRPARRRRRRSRRLRGSGTRRRGDAGDRRHGRGPGLDVSAQTEPRIGLFAPDPRDSRASARSSGARRARCRWPISRPGRCTSTASAADKLARPRRRPHRRAGRGRRAPAARAPTSSTSTAPGTDGRGAMLMPLAAAQQRARAEGRDQADPHLEPRRRRDRASRRTDAVDPAAPARARRHRASRPSR